MMPEKGQGIASMGKDTTLRILAAASRLRHFTVAELTQTAEVADEAARSFLRRSKYFEQVDSVPQHRGRPKDLWRLRPECELDVVRRLTTVTDALREPPEDGIPMGEPTNLGLLEASLVALESGAILPADRSDEFELAKLYLSVAETELRDRRLLSLPVGVDEQRKVERARRRITLLRRQYLPTKLVTRLHALVHVGSQIQSTFRNFLEDWTAPIGIPEFEESAKTSLLDSWRAEDFLDATLHLAKQLPDPTTSVLVPGVMMVQCGSYSNLETRNSLVRAICERLSDPSVADQPSTLTALAASAAAIDAQEASEPLFRALLYPDLVGKLGYSWHRTCALSLARLARPDPMSGNFPIAASACHYLLLHNEKYKADLPILGIAALSAPHADAPSLLHRLGAEVFDYTSINAVWKGPVEQGAMMRNLGLTLHAGQFAALQASIDELLEQDGYGRALVAALREPQYAAMELTDANGEADFVVRVGHRVAQSLSLHERKSFPLKLIQSTAARLSEMISASNWAPHLSGMGRVGRVLTDGLARRARGDRS